MTTLSEVNIGFLVEFWVYGILQIILKSNQEGYSRIFRKTRGKM